MFGRGQQLGFELLLADFVFPVTRIDLVLAGQFGDEHCMNDGAVDVGATEAVVARDGARADAQGAVGLAAEGEDRDVARTAAEIDDHRLRLFADAVERRLALASDEIKEGGQRFVE